MSDKKTSEPPSKEPHASPLRELMASPSDQPYTSFQTLLEAQQDAQGVVVLEGDDGGQIYVVCPARTVRCSEQILAQLLSDIDAAEWDEPDMARLCYERLPVGAIVPGGMGGGKVTEGVWVHRTVDPLREDICSVLAGSRPRLYERAD